MVLVLIVPYSGHCLPYNFTLRMLSKSLKYEVKSIMKRYQFIFCLFLKVIVIFLKDCFLSLGKKVYVKFLHIKVYAGSC